MIKKTLVFLLVLVLPLCVAPLFSAAAEDGGWRIYCEDLGEDLIAATVVVPAKYTRLSDAPLVETVNAADPNDRAVFTPVTERIRYASGGKTETRWTMRIVCARPENRTSWYGVRFAVPPDSVLDDAGNGNPRVCFEDEVEYQSVSGYAEIEVFSSLLLRDYGRADGTVAVGDTLRVDYSGLYPVEILLNGEKAAEFPAGEAQRYTYDVTKTGSLAVAVRQNGGTLAERSLTVINSREMYERNLRDGLVTGEDIPSTGDLVDVGVPAGSPFIPIAKLIAFLNGIRIFFERLFSFTRIG